jgi:hypothetical protein
MKDGRKEDEEGMKEEIRGRKEGRSFVSFVRPLLTFLSFSHRIPPSSPKPTAKGKIPESQINGFQGGTKTRLCAMAERHEVHHHYDQHFLSGGAFFPS